MPHQTRQTAGRTAPDDQIVAGSDPQDGPVDLLPPPHALAPLTVGAAPDSVRACSDRVIETG